MSAPALKKLTITHLRGSVSSFELAFETSRKLTIIYGENGTGKSTICDALEFLGKGHVGSLDNRGLGEEGNQLGRAITRARNNQNAIRSADFAALDPNQERLRRELAAIGVSYHYRPSAEARSFVMPDISL